MRASKRGKSNSRSEAQKLALSTERGYQQVVLPWSLVITVSDGQWHVSVSRLSKQGRLIPLEQWTEAEAMAAQLIALDALHGAGDGVTQQQADPLVLHYRRPLSEAERTVTA